MRLARLWLLLIACSCGSDDTSHAAAPAPIPAEAPAPAPAALPSPTEPKYAASAVLITWAGALDAPAGVTRTRREALELATQVRERALAGESFAALAGDHSDGPSGKRGGELGVYVTGTMLPDFEAAVASVAVGEIAPLIESPFGYHVARRDPVVEVHVAHVVVPFSGAWRSAATRSRDEAQALASRARERLEAGEAFGTVAREVSEDPSRMADGDIGFVSKGQLVPAFEDVAFSLAIGETSGVFETPYGFHIVRRLE